MDNYVSPKRLRKGSRVAIVAPASPFRSDEMLASLDVIREVGLVPVLGENVRNVKSDRVHAANVIDRADELMWAFTDPTIDGIIAATGGFGSAGVLPYLDYAAISRSRKPLLGMSDVTALNNGLLAGARLISINGQSPNIRVDEGEARRESDAQSFATTLQMMMSDKEWGEQAFETMNRFMPRTIVPGAASGHVVGCNAETFTTLFGTPFMPNVEGAILFVEDVHKDGSALARIFLHIEMVGVLDAVAGVVIGQFEDVPDKTDPKVPDVDDVLREYFGDLEVPVAFGYSFSHGDMTIPIPVGAQCEMDATTGRVSFRFTMA